MYKTTKNKKIQVRICENLRKDFLNYCVSCNATMSQILINNINQMLKVDNNKTNNN
jgi:hypothetical protein